jgi:hypothetical protein
MGPGTAAGATAIGVEGMRQRLMDRQGEESGPSISPDQAIAMERSDQYRGWESPENRHMPREEVMIAAPPVEEPAVAVARKVVAPREVVRVAPMPPRRETVVVREPEYQSVGGVLVRPDNSINWGDTDSPSDFFRADQELMRRGNSQGGRNNEYAYALQALARALGGRL